MQHSNYARETSSNPRFSAWLRGEFPTALVPGRNGTQCQASVLGDLPRARLDRFYLLLSAVYRTASNARQQTLCRSLRTIGDTAEFEERAPMKSKTSNLLGPALRDYFTDHLPRLRGMSPNTIQSYRDSLVLLLRFLACDRKRSLAVLDLTDIDPERVLAFLSYLERDRKNGVTTRNVRISAIHGFFRYVGTRHPDQLGLVHRILGIPFKQARERSVEYLEYDEIEAVLSAIDQKTLDERRDYALSATMFNTAARVQEIVDLRGCDLQLTRPFQVRILGKGPKE